MFRLGHATNPALGLRRAFGTDVGGGNRFSMLSVLDEGYKVGMLNHGTVKDPAEAERNKLSAYRAFWSITLGGAEALYLDEFVGNFALGKEADLVVLDWNAGQAAQAWHQSLNLGEGSPTTKQQAADLLFGIMMVGDDRSVTETWVMGDRLFART